MIAYDPVFAHAAALDRRHRAWEQADLWRLRRQLQGDLRQRTARRLRRLAGRIDHEPPLERVA